MFFNRYNNFRENAYLWRVSVMKKQIVIHKDFSTSELSQPSDWLLKRKLR